MLAEISKLNKNKLFRRGFGKRFALIITVFFNLSSLMKIQMV